MPNDVIYKLLNTPADFDRVFTLQLVIWDMSHAEAMSPHTMLAITHNGGMLIGAESDGELVGYTIAFPVRRGNEWLLWSYMTGVLQAYQGRSIGFALKQAQRRWALEHGYEVVAWTFDPLQRGNANFNMRRLGATANTYLVNLYGEMTDGINAGMQSDRFETMWHLQNERVVALAKGYPGAPWTTVFPREAFLLRTEGNKLVTRPFDSDLRWCFAEIPYDLITLKATDLDQAKAWQLALRRVMLAAFESGYTVVDFGTQGDRCWYVLTNTFD